MSDKNKSLSTYVKKEYKFNKKECTDFSYSSCNNGNNNFFTAVPRTS